MGLIKGKTTKEVAVRNNENKTLSVSPTPELLIQQAIDQKVPIETMEKLMAMRRELREEEARDSYYKDLAAFQAECPVIGKSKSVTDKEDKGGALRYKYAPLGEIVAVVNPFLCKHGFSYTFKSKQTDTAYTAICIPMHRDGHSESTEFVVPVDLKAYMSAPQKVGSARSFANRYAFCNAFGIQTSEDNDAQSVGESPPVEEEKKEVVKSAQYKAVEKEIFKDVKNRHFKGVVVVDGDKVDLTGMKAQVQEMMKKKVYSDKKINDVRERVARFLFVAEERDKQPPKDASEPEKTEDKDADQSKEIVIDKPEVIPGTEVEPPAKSVEYLEIEARMIKDISHKAFVGKVWFAKKEGEKKDEVDLGKYRRELPNNLAKNVIPIEDLQKKADIIALLLQASLDKYIPRDTGHEKFTVPDPRPAGMVPDEGAVDPADEPTDEGQGSFFDENGNTVEVEREGNLTDGG